MTAEPHTETPTVREDLLSAIEVIEAQPVSDRADGYAALHDELARRLQAGPPDPAARP